MSNEQKAPILPAKYAGLPKGRWTTLGEMEAVKLLHDDAPRLAATVVELRERLEDAIKIAESWVHDQLDGTSGLKAALDEIEPLKAALENSKEFQA